MLLAFYTLMNAWATFTLISFTFVFLITISICCCIQWATMVLRTYTSQGYVLDKKRLENGQIFDEEYFEHLLDEIREIRASERKFYQKITDIYSTAVDYSKDAKTTKDFFATVQNKLHFAIHGHTATGRCFLAGYEGLSFLD